MELKSGFRHRGIFLAISTLTAFMPGCSHADEVRTAGAVELPEVQVNARKEEPEGSAESGYRNRTATAGPLGRKEIVSLPMSVSVTPSAFIENIQAGNTTDALRYNASVNPNQGSDRSCDYLQIRGFTNKTNTAIDGLRADASLGILEDKERIEILSGANSFLSGIASPAGMVNYVLKRPTTDPMFRATVGNYGGEQAYVHIDAGGPIASDDKFGYRINVLGVDNGNIGVEGESRERYLLSGALDWRVMPNTLLQFDASKFHVNDKGLQAFFFYNPSTVTRIPDGLDPAKNYGASLGRFERTYSTVGANFTSKINDTFTLRGALRSSEWATGRVVSMEPTLVNNSGDYYQGILAYNSDRKNTTNQGNVFLDSVFDTGSLKHKVTFGYGRDAIKNMAKSPGAGWYEYPTTVGNLSSPVSMADPNLPFDSRSPYVKTGDTLRQMVLLGDQIDFNDQWSALVGGTYASIRARIYSNTGALTSDYEKGAFTPSASLMFKPIPAVTTYFSYMESLEQGPIAPATTANANEQLDPYLSRQIEFGAKSVIGGVDVNAALFRIEKANAYTDVTTKIYSEDGRQVHTGIEMSFTGRVTKNMTLLGGLTLIDAKVTKTSDPTMEGKSPQAVPKAIARLYGEYDIPSIKGLTLSGGISYMGKEWVNNANTLYIPHVVLADIGARYSQKIGGKNTVFRLNVSNVADKHYWMAFGEDALNVGSNRTVAFSATVDF